MPLPEMLSGPARFARMGGSSIARPSAAGWVTDFLNTAYYARPVQSREVDDLRLAFCVLTTFWHRLGRRLGAGDLQPFHRAFGGGRGRRLRTFESPTLDRSELLAGAEQLLGPGFAQGYTDPERRGWGIVFTDARAREAHVPEQRMRHAALGALTPPDRSPQEQRWHTYPGVAVASVDSALELLADVSRWPEFGASFGRFTALRSGGLEGQTFEIEVVASPTARTPVFMRGYVTVTRLLPLESRADELATYTDELETIMRQVNPPGGDRPMPLGGEARALVELTSHSGHFMGPAVSRLLLYESEGRAFVRDIGSWDPMPAHLALPYRLAGHRAQISFWGGGEPHASMLHQLALRTG